MPILLTNRESFCTLVAYAREPPKGDAVNALLEALQQNGATPIAIVQRPSDGETIVLAKKAHDGWPYVTWFFNPDSGSLFWGHYFYSAADARQDFDNRIADR